MHLLAQLWRDTDGFIISSELVLIGSVCVLTFVVGFNDLGNSIDRLNQNSVSTFNSQQLSYRYAGLNQTSGSTFGDSSGPLQTAVISP